MGMSSGWVNKRDTLTEFCYSKGKCHISIFCGHKFRVGERGGQENSIVLWNYDSQIAYPREAFLLQLSDLFSSEPGS